jgi:hypothetical protein
MFRGGTARVPRANFRKIRKLFLSSHAHAFGHDRFALVAPSLELRGSFRRRKASRAIARGLASRADSKTAELTCEHVNAHVNVSTLGAKRPPPLRWQGSSVPYRSHNDRLWNGTEGGGRVRPPWPGRGMTDLALQSGPPSVALTCREVKSGRRAGEQGGPTRIFPTPARSPTR